MPVPDPDFDAAFCRDRTAENLRRYDQFFRFAPIDPNGPDADPLPTAAERAARCTEMGLLVCTCTGVERGDRPRALLYDPRCPVHNRLLGKVA